MAEKNFSKIAQIPLRMFPCLSIIKVRKNETLSHSEGEYRKSAGIR